jgi:tetratricopeptide (TPR) repeat protein
MSDGIIELMLDTDTLKKYEKSLQKDPQSKLFAPLADHYREVGRTQEAELLAKSGIKNHPDYPGGYIVLAKIQKGKNDLENALQNLRTCIEKAPDNVLSYQIMAEIFLERRNLEEALKAHKMALFLNPMNELSRRAIEKLERISAESFAKEVFEVRSVDSLIKDTKLKPMEDLDRTLSVVDALILRNESIKAKEILTGARMKHPDHPEIESRIRLIQNSGSTESTDHSQDGELIEPRRPRKTEVTVRKIKLLRKILRTIDAKREKLFSGNAT